MTTENGSVSQRLLDNEMKNMINRVKTCEYVFMK